MALITCVDCARPLSDVAPICPTCGRPTAWLRNLAKKALMLTAVAALAATLYEVRHAGALGVPTTTPLTYSGSLMTFGAPDNGTHTMTLALFVAGANDGGIGSAACSVSQSVTCVNGQFSLPLSSACVTIVQQNPNTQAELTVDNVPMGLVNVGAVPYALEAGNAASVAAGNITGALPVTPLLSNVGLSAAVSGNALTVTLTQGDGVSAPTSTSPVIIGFRSTSATSGAPTPVTLTSSPNVTVPAGATLGQINGAPERTFIYAQDVMGTVQLCVSTSGLLDEGTIQGAAAIGTSSPSRTTLYCQAAGSGPVRLIGRLAATEFTAGTWSTAPSEVAVEPFLDPAITSGGSASRLDIEFGYFSSSSTYGQAAADNCSSGACVLLSASPGVTQVVWDFTGAYTIDFAPGTYSAPPACTVNVTAFGVAEVAAAPVSYSSTFYSFYAENSSASPLNATGYFICVGFH